MAKNKLLFDTSNEYNACFDAAKVFLKAQYNVNKNNDVDLTLFKHSLVTNVQSVIDYVSLKFIEKHFGREPFDIRVGERTYIISTLLYSTITISDDDRGISLSFDSNTLTCSFGLNDYDVNDTAAALIYTLANLYHNYMNTINKLLKAKGLKKSKKRKSKLRDSSDGSISDFVKKWSSAVSTFSNNTSTIAIPEPKLFDCYIYHANCIDGLASVAIALHMQNHKSDSPWTTIAMVHGDPIDFEQFKDKRVCFLDFSVPAEEMCKIISVAKRVTVIDHHVSNYDELSRIASTRFEYVYDVDMSGAGLAWDYFIGTNLPYAIEMIQDRDIWTKKHPDSDPYSLAIRVNQFKLVDMCDYINDIVALQLTDPTSLDKTTIKLIKDGYVYTTYQNYMVRQIASFATKGVLNDGTVVMSVNCIPSLTSDVGSYLSENNTCGVALIYSDTADKRMYSLRVAADCDFDASAYAKSKGGGGHRRSAGFSIKLNKT